MAEMIVSTLGSVAGIREGWKSEACRLFSFSTGASPVPTLPLPRHLFATRERADPLAKGESARFDLFTGASLRPCGEE